MRAPFLRFLRRALSTQQPLQRLAATMSRRSACLAAAAEASQPSAALQLLPLPLAQRIFTLLPVDSRARAACVARAWRAALADPLLWTRLDLSENSGVARRADDAVLRAAAALAQGKLEVLDVGRRVWSNEKALREVVAENAASLRELRSLLNVHTFGWHRNNEAEADVADLRAVLAATPNLRLLEADVTCSWAMARHLLCNEPPYGPLRLRHLHVDLEFADRDVAALVADLAAHSAAHALEALTFSCSDTVPLTPDEFDTIVTIVLALRIPSLYLEDCYLTPEAVPSLVRLLGGATLTHLRIEQWEFSHLFLDADSAVQFADGLRANRTLQRCRIVHALRFTPGLMEIVNALIAHPSLRSLECPYIFMPEGASDAVRDEALRAAGAALGALVAANAPLEELDISNCGLGDEGLGPLCDALRRNTRLRKLLIADNDMTQTFVAQRLLPAVRANTSLRHLEVEYDSEETDLAHEAALLVASRAARAAS